MDWERFVEAAKASSWVTYLGTIDSDGCPHVSVVAPGFSQGSVWFGTRRRSKKFRNLLANSAASFHWPVGNHDAPGEVIARGVATLFETAEDRKRLWEADVLGYDMSGAFGSPDNEDLAFVEVKVGVARLLRADFVAERWVRSDRLG